MTVCLNRLNLLERITGCVLAALACALLVVATSGPAQAQLRNPCPSDWLADGDCDEPEGLGLCAEGTDVVDCSNPNANYGTGPGYAREGQAPNLRNPCPAQWQGDGDCDEPEGLGLCAEGTDPIDCSNPNANFGGGIGYQPPGGVQTNICPQGFTFTNGTCQPVQQFSCPLGYTLTNGVCQPVQQPNPCPQGYSFNNGICQPVQQAVCPQGQVMMNGACVTDPCPQGYAFANGACQPTQQPPAQPMCPQGQVMMNGTCQPDPCPQGFVFANGTCQPGQAGQQTGQPPAQPGQQTGDQPCPAGQVRILGVCQSASGTPIN